LWRPPAQMVCIAMTLSAQAEVDVGPKTSVCNSDECISTSVIAAGKLRWHR